jgi:predicted secreted Zn-dependent protease
VFSPIPDAGDFRVDIPNEYRDELQKISDERVAHAMKDAWDRLHECLTRMSEKLAGDEKQLFRDSLVTNAVDLCATLSKLNVTNDPKLERARHELEKTLIGIDAKELRKSDEVRLDVKSRVDEILSMF